MKARIVLIAVMVGCLALALPGTGHSWGYYGYQGCYGGCGSYYSNGWGWGAAIAGGLVAGLIIGTVIADRDKPPPPVVVRRTTTTFPGPGVPYAYPDPDFIAKYGGTTPPATTGGEWITVPGQYVDAIWVPEHKVWAPADRTSAR